jgi:hypothetical protein
VISIKLSTGTSRWYTAEHLISVLGGRAARRCAGYLGVEEDVSTCWFEV